MKQNINKLWFLIIIYFLINFLKLLFKYSFLPFPPTPAQSPTPPHLPPISTTPVIVHVSFIIVPANPSPFSP